MIRALPLLGALLLAACAAPRPPPPAPRPPSPLLGVPLDVAVRGLDGAEVRLGGPGPIRVVDLFASWCDPCRAQLPALGALAERRPGLSVVAVSLDDDRAALDRFLAEVPAAFPVLWDRGGAVVQPALQVRRLPTTLLVDRGGVIRGVYLGHDSRVEAQLEREASALLGPG